MLNDNAKFFTEDFKTKTIEFIKVARFAFCQEVFRAGPEDIQGRPSDFSTVEFHPGFRFFSDEQCWHSFVTQITKGQPWLNRHENQNKEEALNLEFKYDRDREEWRKATWSAVKEAARCDYHYHYEKEY